MTEKQQRYWRFVRHAAEVSGDSIKTVRKRLKVIRARRIKQKELFDSLKEEIREIKTVEVFTPEDIQRLSALEDEFERRFNYPYPYP